MKVVEYWHGTIKNYRYDGDVSVCSAHSTSSILPLFLFTPHKTEGVLVTLSRPLSLLVVHYCRMLLT